MPYTEPAKPEPENARNAAARTLTYASVIRTIQRRRRSFSTMTPQTIAFDTETWPIEPGLLAPPLVCLQWQSDGTSPKMCHREQALAHIEEWLDSDTVLVGHNVAYDMAVIMAQWPRLAPKIFEKYARNEITDTKIREQLIMIACGTFRCVIYPDGMGHAVGYSLADCVFRHFGEQLKKEGWRLFYRALDGYAVSDWLPRAEAFLDNARHGLWPEWATTLTTDTDRKGLLEATAQQAIDYALEDARTTLRLYRSQDAYARANCSRLFADEFRQARAAFALHLSSCWGIHTDPEAVDALEASLRADFEALKFELQGNGLVREDGSADTKAAMAKMAQACLEANVPVMLTGGGKVSLSAEACGRFDPEEIDDAIAGSDAEDDEAGKVIGKYSRFLRLRKTLSNDIKMLRSGCDIPIQPRYDIADSGRCRAAKPNIQAINRDAGIREAFRPRPGTVFIQADFEGLELHTLAAWCLEKIGWSRLAEALNAGRDVHIDMAAELLGITYEDALARHKAGDKEIKEYRQRAKALNFGLPGGLGVKKFVRYAKTSFGATITEEEARAYKAAWLRKYPELLQFFNMAAAATNNPEKLGTEAHVFTERLRGKVRYSALCNGRFQGLGADAAKEALWRVTKACYADPRSPLYGARVVAFIHDEIICEIEASRAAEAAVTLGALMREGANVYLGKVPVRLKPLIMRVWSKNAEPTFDSEGRLIPWEPKN